MILSFIIIENYNIIMVNLKLPGGSVKKLYEEVGKSSVCGKNRVIYKKVS
jgi:hypothetical protein